MTLSLFITLIHTILILIVIVIFIFIHRWRASVYKLIMYDLLVMLALYYLLSFTYMFILEDEQKE